MSLSPYSAIPVARTTASTHFGASSKPKEPKAKPQEDNVKIVYVPVDRSQAPRARRSGVMGMWDLIYKADLLIMFVEGVKAITSFIMGAR